MGGGRKKFLKKVLCTLFTAKMNEILNFKNIKLTELGEDSANSY